MTDRFNPPPNWPEPPHEGWLPPEDFRPRPSWGPIPAGWRLWLSGRPEAGPSPLMSSEDVPASGARPRERVDTYPVEVLNPGMWTQNHLQDEDYGFPPPKPYRSRPRLRLAVTIVVTVLGFLLAAATVLLFVWLTEFAIEDLPERLAADAWVLAPAVDGDGPSGTMGGV